MAYITITTNANENDATLTERVVPSDMESDLYCRHLVERLSWAIDDAQAIDATHVAPS